MTVSDANASPALRRPWLKVAAWLVLIYGLIPLARPLSNLAKNLFGIPGLRILLLLGIALPVAAVLRKLIQIRASRFRWAVFVTWLGILSWLAWKKSRWPDELLHIPEYIVLSALVLYAFGVRTRDLSVFAVTLAFCSLAGTLDEMIQWLVPGRIFDVGDVYLNVLSAVLGLVLVGLVIQPAWLRAGWSRRGTRLALRWTAACVALVGLGHLATPARLTVFEPLLPGAWYDALQAQPMVEYGYGFDHFEPARFKSRLSEQQLLEADRRRNRTAIGILEREGDDAHYEDFLLRYPPYRAPFLYEMRVHLFRRDRCLSTMHKHAPGSEAHERYRHAAWREQCILTRYFGETLRATPFALSAMEVEVLRRGDDPARPYTSPVGEHLHTRMSERGVFSLTLLLLVLLLAADVALGRGAKKVEGS